MFDGQLLHVFMHQHWPTVVVCDCCGNCIARQELVHSPSTLLSYVLRHFTRWQAYICGFSLKYCTECHSHLVLWVSSLLNMRNLQTVLQLPVL